MTDTAPLYSPATVRALLERHRLRADKAFGQNFLIDGNVLRNIVAAAEVQDTDTVFEVGPGLGVLTRELAEQAGRVVSVELDARLLPVLRETTADYPNVALSEGDALDYDLTSLPPQSLFVANLPYNVATPLVVRALESLRFRRLVFLVQKEVAERLSASPATPSYGALSLVVQHFARVRVVQHVGPNAFFPAPDITSSVVRLDVNPDAEPDPATFRLIRDAFRHRRKTLKKNLTMAGYDATRVTEVLEGLELDPKIRAEALGLEHFRRLGRALA
ncbi:MAG: 16S rRNA (adenine(1518)-N(6)/adenine(1519)-N(6))-dimethyltransferase RsmA [Trueperaceae bacterium]|nr:16S rRNA (adenine(1518)-N(6)/adenine(1519)-N(6))-dimethyltransferase RsmA [Trueperaceae bacterium]